MHVCMQGVVVFESAYVMHMHMRVIHICMWLEEYTYALCVECTIVITRAQLVERFHKSMRARVYVAAAHIFRSIDVQSSTSVYCSFILTLIMIISIPVAIHILLCACMQFSNHRYAYIRTRVCACVRVVDVAQELEKNTRRLSNKKKKCNTRKSS